LEHLADSSPALVEAWPLALGPPSPDSPRHPIATSPRSHPTLYHDLTQYNFAPPLLSLENATWKPTVSTSRINIAHRSSLHQLRLSTFQTSIGTQPEELFQLL
jgi:hypothetical protein